MLDAYASLMLPEFLAAHSFADQPAEMYPSDGIYITLRTQDGHLLELIAQDSQFQGICNALDCQKLLTDPRFSTAADRFAAMDILLAALEEKTIKMLTRDVLKALWAKAEVPIAPANTLRDFMEDPQVQHNGTVVQV